MELPSFKHGNIIVNESYGACFYLESQFKNKGTKLIPDDTDQKALMYQRMFEGPTFYDKVLTAIYYDYLVPEGERHDSAVKRNKEALVTELNLWEGYLQKLCCWALALTWLDRLSHWPMWLFFRLLVIFSDLGCLLSVTLNWESIMLW
ncbi:glutathione S-transferase A-like [Acanthochromis polyacanthus]|uniref:glutathione S-transferase A-like n=1 Tax=Acanthochromis polyacanthus TaxID=80966 RepID=UPI002234E8DC|nr:glutathione S-transferase A-like [Acanthochromis polyacanthus]